VEDAAGRRELYARLQHAVSAEKDPWQANAVAPQREFAMIEA